MVSVLGHYSAQDMMSSPSSSAADEESKQATSSVATSDPVAATQEHVITARRSRDGFLTFDVRMSHIIEQTLLRAFKRPNFRKSTIKVIDDFETELPYRETEVDRQTEPAEKPEKSDSLSHNNNNDFREKIGQVEGAEVPMDSSSELGDRNLVPIKLQLKRKYAPDADQEMEQVEAAADKTCNKISSQEAEIFLKRTSWDLQPNTQTSQTISAIPTSWLSRGISSDEKRQFQRSIANASLCPHERKKGDNLPADDSNGANISQQTIYEEEEELTDPFPPPSPPVDYSQSRTNASPAVHGASIASAPVVPSLYIPQQSGSPHKAGHHASSGSKRRRVNQASGYVGALSSTTSLLDPDLLTQAPGAAGQYSAATSSSIDYTSTRNPSCFD